MKFPNCQQFIEIIGTELKKAQKSSSTLLGAIDLKQFEGRDTSDSFSSLWDEWASIQNVKDFFMIAGRTLELIWTLGYSEIKAKIKARKEDKEKAWDTWLEDIEKDDRKKVEEIVQKIFGDKKVDGERSHLLEVPNQTEHII